MMVEFLALMSEHLSSAFALLGVLLMIVLGLYLRHVRMTTRTLLVAALMLALMFLLYQLRIYHFPQGGSITAGSMVPLLLLSYRYGPGVGALAGFLYGLLHMMQDPFILHPIQVLFDYPLPFVAIGLAGALPNHLVVSTALAFLGKFLCHFISGLVFFSSYAPEGMSPVIYSLTVNASLMIPECLICCLILKLLPVRRLLSAMGE